jgi:NYN domain
MFRRRKRSALLVDFDNVFSRYGMAYVHRIENWLAWMQDGGFDPEGVPRKFLAQRVYWFTDNDRFRANFVRHGFEASVCRAVRNKEKASSADFDITIDAAELRHDFKNIEEVIILSFDSDFLTVLNHLQLNELDVVGMAAGQDRPAKAYRQLADRVIEREDLERAFSYERPKRGWFGLRVKPKPQPSAAPIAAPAQGGAGRKFDLPRAARIAEETAAQAPSAYLSMRFIIRALRDFDGFTERGPQAWLGCGGYAEMIHKFAALNPNLAVDRTRHGVLVLVYRGRDAIGGGEALAPA